MFSGGASRAPLTPFSFITGDSGEHWRSLVYGCFTAERTWERAEGSPEPWEREVLFDRERLEQLLEDMDKFGESQHEKREVERIWRDAEIRPGQISQA
jgi:hypothetical protein